MLPSQQLIRCKIVSRVPGHLAIAASSTFTFWLLSSLLPPPNKPSTTALSLAHSNNLKRQPWSATISKGSCIATLALSSMIVHQCGPFNDHLMIPVSSLGRLHCERIPSSICPQNAYVCLSNHISTF